MREIPHLGHDVQAALSASHDSRPLSSRAARARERERGRGGERERGRDREREREKESCVSPATEPVKVLRA